MFQYHCVILNINSLLKQESLLNFIESTAECLLKVLPVQEGRLNQSEYI